MRISGFLLFPGQGAQAVGMARDAFQLGGHAVALFEEASDILGYDLARTVFEGDPDHLARTDVCQPALLVSCLALLSTLRERRETSFSGAAGLSLGEYTALVALEAVDFADAVRLVRRRGELMEEAAARRPGGMASALGLEAGAVVEACARASDHPDGKTVVAANFNCPGQVVISGDRAALERAAVLLRAAGARRVAPLDVSGAFHSPLMESAREGLAEALAGTAFRAPRGLFVNNADARPLEDPADLRDSLARQLVSPVRWEASCRLLAERGVRTFFEVGPGRTCQGMLRRTVPEAEAAGFASVADMDRWTA